MLSLNLSGVKEIQKAIEGKNEALTKGLEAEIEAAALEIEKGAKKRAPVNFGRLRQSIHTNGEGLTKTVEAGVKYAPYVEFGTGGKVEIPAGFESLAASFKGKGNGTLAEMIKDLTEWVKKKGLAGNYSVKSGRRLGGKAKKQDEDRKLAQWIAIKILRNGVPAQPYMIPSYLDTKPKLLKRLKRLFKA